MKITVIDTNKSPIKLKRVAGYARVSVSTQESSSSLNAQSTYLKSKICSNSSYLESGIFLDLGITGTKTERPGFKALMDKCEKGEVDLIITKSISRFCRNTVDLLSTVRHLKNLGVEVYFDENKLSTFSKEGELLLTLLASQAQEESRSISENVLWSVKKRFEQGEGIPHLILGYCHTSNGYKIVEKEAETVRRIFDLYLSGLGCKEIANRLNSDGLVGLYGKKFTSHAISIILRQEKYMGDSILQKTFTENHITHKKIKNTGQKDRYYVENTHPPIVTREIFDRVQQEIKRRQTVGSLACNWTIKTSVFTSKIICIHCGRSFRRKTLKRKNYPVYHKWVCGERIDKRRGGGCTSKSIPEWALYKLTEEILEDRPFDEVIEHIEAGEEHKITFILKDKTKITKTWRNNRWPKA